MPIDVADFDGARVELDPPTQTTLAAILAAVDGLEAALALLGTEDTLADLLAKVIASPATEAKQDDVIAVLPAALGTAVGANAFPVVEATDSLVVSHLNAIKTASESTSAIPVVSGGREYETVAASQTAQVLGPTGATGDDIDGLLVIPTSVSPQGITLLDNATSISVFAGGTNSLSNYCPFFIPLGLKSVSGAWKVTTGTGLSVIAIGNFT